MDIFNTDSSETSMVKSPFASVVVPLSVPFTETDAPCKGSRVSLFVILPLIVRGCANPIAQINTITSSKEILFSLGYIWQNLEYISSGAHIGKWSLWEDRILTMN